MTENHTFPSIDVQPIEAGTAKLPCLICMIKGATNRYGPSCQAEKIVEIADIMKFPACVIHAEEFFGRHD